MYMLQEIACILRVRPAFFFEGFSGRVQPQTKGKEGPPSDVTENLWLHGTVLR